MIKNYYYVYRITNTILRKHYYGYRHSLIAPKDDLGVKYFSSSSDKDFIKDQKENRHNYKYKIIRLFESKSEAIKFEITLHLKFNVEKNKSFYNKRNQSSVKFDNTGKQFKRIVSLKTGKIKQISLEEDVPKGYILGSKLSSKLSKKVSFTDGFVNISLDIFNDKIPENFVKGFTRASGVDHPNFGKNVYNDGVKEYFLKSEDADSLNLIFGRIENEGFKAINDKIIYNNGIISKYFFEGEEEDGFIKGRLEEKITRQKNFSQEHKDNISKFHANFKGQSHPGAKMYLIRNKDGREYFSFGNIVLKCRELNINYDLLKQFEPNFVERKTKNNSTIGWSITEVRRIKL
jgi:hypothetical protein